MPKCNSCGEEIIWIKTPRGKNHPVDAKPVRFWVPNAHGWRMLEGHQTHFASCPQGQDWRGNPRSKTS